VTEHVQAWTNGGQAVQQIVAAERVVVAIAVEDTVGRGVGDQDIDAVTVPSSSC